MVHWSLVLLAFAAGALFGVFLVALIAADRGGDDK